MDTKQIGETIRSERRRAGLTQKELAPKAGVSHPVIIRAERGEFVSAHKLDEICKTLGIRITARVE